METDIFQNLVFFFKDALFLGRYRSLQAYTVDAELAAER